MAIKCWIMSLIYMNYVIICQIWSLYWYDMRSWCRRVLCIWGHENIHMTILWGLRWGTVWKKSLPAKYRFPAKSLMLVVASVIYNRNLWYSSLVFGWGHKSHSENHLRWNKCPSRGNGRTHNYNAACCRYGLWHIYVYEEVIRMQILLILTIKGRIMFCRFVC